MISVVTERNREILNSIRLRGLAGLDWLKKERAWQREQEAIDFINGNQEPTRTRNLSKVVTNKVRRNLQELISALSDVRQIWEYEVNDPAFQKQAGLLSTIVRDWWARGRMDKHLASTIFYSAVGGTGYLYLYWDAETQDIAVKVFDPRDVIPMGPTYESPQKWQGVILRERVDVDWLVSRHPEKRDEIVDGKQQISWFGNEARGGTAAKLSEILTAAQRLFGGSAYSNRPQQGQVELMRVYLKDYSVNTSGEPRQMGAPGTNWEYTVQPGEAVYPRGRFVLCTPNCVLEDTPNPYWHGQFPIIPFTLDPLPWSLLGAAVAADLLPLQNALNESIRTLDDGLSQWARRGIIADVNAVPKNVVEATDTRKAGMKLYTNPNASPKDAIQVVDGPQYPTWVMAMPELYEKELAENLGVNQLMELTKLAQSAPKGDDLDSYREALTPLLRLRSRMVEVGLLEMGELFKYLVFQFYTLNRRVALLGPDGATIQDKDISPGNMIPSMTEGMEGYAPEYDGMLPVDVRAKYHAQRFVLKVEENSMLRISNLQNKMLHLQLFRAQALPPQRLWQVFDIKGYTPTDAPIEEQIFAARRSGLMAGPPPELVQVQVQAAQIQLAQAKMQFGAQQAQMAAMAQGGGPPPPGGPSKLSDAIKGTNNSGAAGGGRPPSGQEPPQMVIKSGEEGPRTVISESGK